MVAWARMAIVKSSWIQIYFENKVKRTFSDELDVTCERKRNIEVDSEALD